jgi:hypothetical protein
MSEIINTLILKLKFIPIPENHLKNLITHITVYSQHTKQILNTFVQELKSSTTPPKNNVFFSKDQKAFYKLKKSQFWFDLHKTHILLLGDKNTGLCIVSIDWVTEQSKQQLYSNGYKLLHQTNKKSYFLSLNLLFCQYCNQIKLLPTNLYNTIQPYKAQLLYWYLIPKIHKNPISTRLICRAYNAFMIYAS